MKNKKYKPNMAGSVAYTASTSQTSKYTTGKNGCTGHGFAAEDANAWADVLKGRKVEKVGMNNAKNGADRIVDGVKIQTKYCRTAKATVESAFDSITGIYKYKQKNGRPMKVEVPSDQYKDAVQLIRKKIIEGKVPGVKNPDHASKMVKKGVVSYNESVRIAKAGTVESIAYDIATGTVSSATSAGISFAITFFKQKNNGASTKEAFKEAGKQSGMAAGTTMATHVIVGQAEKYIVRKGAEKAADAAVKEGAKKASSSAMRAFSKSTMRTNIITATATTVVTTVPDIKKAIKGEITWGECGERATSNAGATVSGIAAASVAVALLNPVGLTAIGVTMVAGIVGSSVGEKATKSAIKLVKKLF